MPITTVSTPNMKRQKDSFIWHKYLLKSTSGNFSFGIHHLYDSSEKHGFMFISWAVYNPLKFEFSLCWSHEKPDTIRNSQIRERAFKGLRRVKLAAADDQKSFYDHFTRPGQSFIQYWCHNNYFVNGYRIWRFLLEGENKNFVRSYCKPPGDNLFFTKN